LSPAAARALANPDEPRPGARPSEALSPAAAREVAGSHMLRPGGWAPDAPPSPAIARESTIPDAVLPEAWARRAPPPSPPAATTDSPASTPARAQPFAAGSGEGRTRAFLQVQGGCDHACTFCVIPQGRGPSFSVPAEALAARLRGLVEGGHKEAVLTGVDIASYGADLPGRPSLGAAVRRLLALVPELPRLRLSSLDPAALDDDLWRLLAEEPRLMPHLHLSLQHGADLVLKRMRRRHGRADALRAARRARDARPGIALGADLIAGFPTETEAHHRDTLGLVEEMGLSFLHVFPYSERPGTPAARMPPVPVPLRRERAARLREAGAAAAARFYAGRVGREETVLFEAGNRGHTEHFAPLRLADGASGVPRGALRRVRVAAADADGLFAAAGEAR
jgi:threonylcarbamoyladenosine tRNA methylthiotransferase MtaB